MMPPTYAQYAKINSACKELGIDKYEILMDRYGLETSKKLTPGQVKDLLSYFMNLGWKVKRKKKEKNKKKKNSPSYSDAQMRMVVGLWITLADAGVIHDRSDPALQKYVKRMTKVDNLRWCSSFELGRLIESLKAIGKREGVTLG